MQKLLFVVVSIILLTGCNNLQIVDVAQPIATADKFYDALKSGDAKTALDQFSPEFKSQVDNWPRLINGLQEKYGPVTAAELESSSLATNDDGPCYSLNYSVKRGTLASNEVLFLCSKGDSSPWLICGHKVIRLDTHQSLTGGILPKEVGIHVP